MRWGPAILTALLPAAALLAGAAARAQAPPPPPEVPVPVYTPRQPDLTLENFFSAGWCDEFHERPATGGAERILLFRTPPPFLERAALLDYQLGLRTGPDRVNESELGGELLLPLNSRLMFDLKAAYDFNGDNLPGTGDAGASITGVLQLIDTPASAVNVRLGFAVPPREDLLPHRLQLELGAAGFQDLGSRFGLQGSFAFDFPLGSSEYGADVAVRYTAALTWTLTEDVPWFGHFTPFAELAGATELGVDERHTQITLLPGAEWELVRGWWVAAGVEVPLTGPRPFDLGLHFAVIKSF